MVEADRERLRRVNDGVEEIRWRLCSNLCRPFTLRGRSSGIWSADELGLAEVGASGNGTISGSTVAIVGRGDVVFSESTGKEKSRWIMELSRLDQGADKRVFEKCSQRRARKPAKTKASDGHVQGPNQREIKAPNSSCKHRQQQKIYRRMNERAGTKRRGAKR